MSYGNQCADLGASIKDFGSVHFCALQVYVKPFKMTKGSQHYLASWKFITFVERMGSST